MHIMMLLMVIYCPILFPNIGADAATLVEGTQHPMFGEGSDHTARGVMRVEPEVQVALGAMPRGHCQSAGVLF